jgi:hypothetical protein
VIAQLIMDHPGSACFGISLAPLSYRSTKSFGYKEVHQGDRIKMQEIR